MTGRYNAILVPHIYRIEWWSMLSVVRGRLRAKIAIGVWSVPISSVHRQDDRVITHTPLYSPRTPSFLTTWPKVPIMLVGAPGPRVCNRTFKNRWISACSLRLSIDEKYLHCSANVSQHIPKS